MYTTLTKKAIISEGKTFTITPYQNENKFCFVEFYEEIEGEGKFIEIRLHRKQLEDILSEICESEHLVNSINAQIQ